MANPVGSILHSRFLIPDNSDRSSVYSFGMTFQCYNAASELITPSGADLTALNDALIYFLNTAATGQTNALAYYMGISASRATNACEIAHYDISNALGLHEPAGSPYSVLPFTLANAASTPAFPEQVAHVIALRTNYGLDPEFGTGTRPRADDRNRLYFGPLNADCFTSDAESPVRCKMNPNFTDDVFTAYSRLYATLLPEVATSDFWMPSVWSRKSAAVKQISEFSQDLYPCTQRRRLSKRSNLLWTPLTP